MQIPSTEAADRKIADLQRETIQFRSPWTPSELHAVCARSDTVHDPPWPPERKVVILVTMTETLALADVKAHLSRLVSQVSREHDRVTVTVHGQPSAVLVAVDDLEALEETISVLADSDAIRQLTASDAELARGEGETERELTEAMQRRAARER